MAAAILLAPFIAGCSNEKPAEKPAVDHSQMPGMSMPVTIPKDALYTEADVRFMQGMIAHHAQAIYMSKMAGAHGANPRVLKFAQKVDQSQITEIRLMQDRGISMRLQSGDGQEYRAHYR